MIVVFFIAFWAWSAARASRPSCSDEGAPVELRSVLPSAFLRSLAVCTALSLALSHGFHLVTGLMLESLVGAVIVIAAQTVIDVCRPAPVTKTDEGRVWS